MGRGKHSENKQQKYTIAMSPTRPSFTKQFGPDAPPKKKKKHEILSFMI